MCSNYISRRKIAIYAGKRITLGSITCVWFYFNAMLLHFPLYDKSDYIQYKYRQEKLKFNSKIVKSKLNWGAKKIWVRCNRWTCPILLNNLSNTSKVETWMSSTEPAISNSVPKGFCLTRHEKGSCCNPKFLMHISSETLIWCIKGVISAALLLILSMTDSIPLVFLSMRLVLLLRLSNKCFHKYQVIIFSMYFLYLYWLVRA